MITTDSKHTLLEVKAAITGHRPERISSMQYVMAQLHNAYRDLGITHVIQGMAAGVDLQSARQAYFDKIGFTCAIPWQTHEPRVGDECLYQWALDHADRVHVVSNAEIFPGPQVYFDRNEWMVDHAHVVIAVWDGKKVGGTYNTIKYALSLGRKVYRIDPSANIESGWYVPQTVQ